MKKAPFEIRSAQAFPAEHTLAALGNRRWDKARIRDIAVNGCCILSATQFARSEVL